MIGTINKTKTLFTPAKAEEMAEMLRAGDSEWSYTVRHDPAGTGYSFIEVRDEKGQLLGAI